MPYATLPDQRIPYDNDGTVIVGGTSQTGCTAYQNNARMLVSNGLNNVANAYLNGMTFSTPGGQPSGTEPILWIWFPEQRIIAGMAGNAGAENMDNFGSSIYNNFNSFRGSNDSTNGLDGTWEVASLSAGFSPIPPNNLFEWRSAVKPVSFTGPKKVLRLHSTSYNMTLGSRDMYYALLHLYGRKAAGQTPDDIIFIDHDTTPGVEYAGPEDFGDRPLGTSVVRQFRIKNTSSSKTANTIALQCNDTDFVISTDGTTWVTTINLASLAAGAESPTYYIRNTTPAPGNPLGPRFARIVATVTSWT